MTIAQVADIRLLPGCRIRTHYGTGGVVTSVTGPRPDGTYAATYEHPRDGKPCWINTIRVENGIITCEGQPLLVLGRERPGQVSLF